MDIKKDIVVSVIIPCYNDAAFIEEALQSVIRQTYTNWECIIVNDGSVDHTADVVKAAIGNDVRFRYIETENNGPSAARNKAIECASGTLILPLDADDTLSENYINECVKVFGQQADVKVVYGKEQKMQQGIKKVKPYSWEKLLFENMIHCCGMFKKADWQSAKGYDVNMRHGFEDWEFWINLINKTGKVVRVDNITLSVRVKDVSRTSNMQSAEQALMRQYVYKKHTLFYNDFFFDPLALYNEYCHYRDTFKAVEARPFHFALSRVLRKVKL
ncbi:glycosyltransferase [soil metagenome]